MTLYNWGWLPIIPVTDTGTVPPHFRYVRRRENGTAVNLAQVDWVEETGSDGEDETRPAEHDG